MQRVDENKVWEARGFGSFADAVGEQEAGGAEAGKTPQRSRIRQGDQTVGCMLICVCARCLCLCCVLIICKVNILKPLRVKFFFNLLLGVRVCVQAKVEEARQAVMEVTTCNTEHLRSATSLNEQKKDLQLKLSTSQKKMVNNVQG